MAAKVQTSSFTVPHGDIDALHELIGQAFLERVIAYDLVIAHEDALIRSFAISEETIAFLKTIHVDNLAEYSQQVWDCFPEQEKKSDNDD